MLTNLVGQGFCQRIAGMVLLMFCHVWDFILESSGGSFTLIPGLGSLDSIAIIDQRVCMCPLRVAQAFHSMEADFWEGSQKDISKEEAFQKIKAAFHDPACEVVQQYFYILLDGEVIFKGAIIDPASQ